MENTPNAAAPQGTEATPNTNSNLAPATSAEANPQALATEPKAPVANVPAEQVEAFNKFVEANGGFEKAFGKMKQTISNPQPQQPEPTQVPNQSTQTQMVMGGPVNGDGTTNDVYMPPKPAEGYITPNEIALLQYREMLAKTYPELNKEGYISKGDFTKEMGALGIPVMDSQGNMNDSSIRKFFDLKKAAIPPAPVSNPVTTTPTVDYVNLEGDITSQETADQIIAQGNKHPRYAEAQKFTRERLFGKKSDPKQK